MNVNTGKPWSKADIQKVRDFSPVMTTSELADYLGRTELEVILKLKEITPPSLS